MWWPYFSREKEVVSALARESQSSRGSKVTLDHQPLRPALLRYECLLCAWRRGLKSSLYEAENGERKKKTSGWRKRRRRGSSLKGAALVQALRFLIGCGCFNLTCSLSTTPNLSFIFPTYYCSSWSVILTRLLVIALRVWPWKPILIEDSCKMASDFIILSGLVQILNQPIK